MVIKPVSACAPGTLTGVGISPVSSVGLMVLSGKSASSPEMGNSGVGGIEAGFSRREVEENASGRFSVMFAAPP